MQIANKTRNRFNIDANSKRNYGLDIARAFAILFVLNAHSMQNLPKSWLLAKVLARINLDGVSLFFVLSGFLIGGILISQFETQQVNFKLLLKFWIRRWFRTLPNYFFTLVILVVLGLHFKTVPDFYSTGRYFLFLENFKSPMPYFLFPEAWSLSVEEWFYVIIPIILFVLIAACKLKPRTALLLTSVSIIGLVIAFRFYRFSYLPQHITGEDVDRYFRKQVITRLDSIMYGVVGAYLVNYHPNSWGRFKKLLFCAGIVLLYSDYLQYIFGVFSLSYRCIYLNSIKPIGFLCLFPYLTSLKSGKGFIYCCFTKLSIISYSVYLLNYSIIKNYIIEYLNHHIYKRLGPVSLDLAQYFTFWVLSLVLASILYKYFEKPFTDLRDTIS